MICLLSRLPGSLIKLHDGDLGGARLPASVTICYKPDMRKWMRDKLKRRKKTPEEVLAAPAPLQPAYFEAEPERSSQQGDVAPEVEATEGEAPSRQETTSSADADADAGVTGAAPDLRPTADSSRRPRRRRRGGRGRKRSGLPTASSSPSPATPIPVSAVPVVQRTKGVVVLAIGLPGSGKSSWFKRHSISPLSSDMLRSLLFDDPAEQGFQDLVFSNLRSMLKARLLARRPMSYVDATNLTPHDRHSWIKLAKDFGYEVQAVFFDVPLEVCLERNHRRQRVVSDDVMREMSAKLKPPAFEEGFSKITVVRVKQQASA